MTNKEKILTLTLPKLLLEVTQIVEAKNNWKDDLWFLEFAPNIRTEGEIDDIGKVIEWRATLSRGYNLDNIFVTHNFFGKTPKKAIVKLRLDLEKILSSKKWR